MSVYQQLRRRLAERDRKEGSTHFIFIAPRDRSAWDKLFEDHIRYQQQPAEELISGQDLALFRIPRAELTATAKEPDVTIELL